MENSHNHVLSSFIYLYSMCATSFLEHDNSSFSKILLSKEVADIIKQVVRESAKSIYLDGNEWKNNKGKHDI